MKKLIVEALGTFFLVSAILLSGNPAAIGLMLMSMIYIGGHISGGNFNPAVTLSLLVQGTHNIMTAVSYIVAQLIGGAGAIGLLYVLTGTMFSVPMPAEASLAKAMLLEALLTSVLCMVVISMTTLARTRASDLGGCVIGLTLAGIASIGGLFNPAVVLAGIAGDPFVYVLGPCLGAVCAALVGNYINEEPVNFNRG